MVDLKALPTPFVQTPTVLATIYSAPTTDEAANGAIHRMAQFLTDFAKIPLNDAGMLMSLVGESNSARWWTRSRPFVSSSPSGS